MLWKAGRVRDMVPAERTFLQRTEEVKDAHHASSLPPGTVQQKHFPGALQGRVGALRVHRRHGDIAAMVMRGPPKPDRSAGKSQKRRHPL